MACNLKDFSSAADGCVDTDGGIAESYAVDCEYIQDVTFNTDGEITAIVMNAADKWVHYKYDVDDDVPYFNQIGERTGKKHITKQTAFFGFAGISTPSVEFANTVKSCCCIVLVHILNSGTALVQGIDRNPVTGIWSTTKKPVKATVSMLSDTGAGEERIEVTFESESKGFSPITTLTGTDIEAL